jgi:hypothetical protein
VCARAARRRKDLPISAHPGGVFAMMPYVLDVDLPQTERHRCARALHGSDRARLSEDLWRATRARRKITRFG